MELRKQVIDAVTLQTAWWIEVLAALPQRQ